MRVLHIITRLISGGAQLNTVRTAIRHRQRGIEAEILTGVNDSDLMDMATGAGVPLHRINALSREPALASDLRALLGIARVLRAGRFDVVHTHTSKAGFLGRLAARLAGSSALIHTPHGHVFHSYYGPLTTRLYVLLERCAAHWTDRLIALTLTERNEHLDLGIGISSQFEIVPSGIEVARFAAVREGARERARVRMGFSGNAIVIGCIGRLAPVKGQDLLLEAFAKVVADHPRVGLAFIGDGDQRSKLSDRARTLGVASVVHFCGRVEEPEEFYPGLDLVAVPSRNEGMGRVVLEAMAAGLAVVASAVGGIRDLIRDHETGILVPPGDIQALADALRKLADDPSSRARLGASARSSVTHIWSEDAMSERLLEIYSGLLAR